MVIINNLYISDTADNIVVDVATSVGNVFTNIKLWTKDTFQDPDLAIDLSSYIIGINETENISIPAIAIGVAKYSGLFFIEFTTSEEVEDTDCCPNSNIRLAVVSNFIKYHECILNRLLKLEIDDCGVKEDNQCKDCQNCANCLSSVLSVQTYVDGLYIAIQYGFYTEAIEILSQLDKLCGVCNTCPDFGETLLIAGGGFGMYNNTLTMF